jgi:spoIIIJ-associated protein
VATQADADELVGMLTELLELADLDVSVKVMELNGRYVNVTLDGRDVSFLVGRRGEVINALQYLMNVMSTRKLHNGVRVVLEGNDYRKKRQDVLTKLATQIAEEVAKRGEEAVLDALPAFERRVVHKALSEFPGIVTYSEGEEPNRRVVIAPES